MAIKGQKQSKETINKRVTSRFKSGKYNHSIGLRQKIADGVKAAWDSGKRQKLSMPWKDIQFDIDSGIRQKEILKKYNMSKNRYDYAVSVGYIKRKLDKNV